MSWRLPPPPLFRAARFGLFRRDVADLERLHRKLRGVILQCPGDSRRLRYCPKRAARFGLFSSGRRGDSRRLRYCHRAPRGLPARSRGDSRRLRYCHRAPRGVLSETRGDSRRLRYCHRALRGLLGGASRRLTLPSLLRAVRFGIFQRRVAATPGAGRRFGCLESLFSARRRRLFLRLCLRAWRRLG